MSSEPKVVAEVEGVKFYRIREATEEDPIVGWEADERSLEPCIFIHLRSGVKLVGAVPRPKLRKVGIVNVTGASKSPGVPLVSPDPHDENPKFTDRKDIVDLVCSWWDDFLRRDRERSLG